MNFKMYFLLSVVGVAIFINCSSQLNQLEKKVGEIHENCDKPDSCLFILKNCVDFEWDTVCFIEGVDNPEFVKQFINADYKGYKEGTEPIIFKKNGQVIYYENNIYDIESNKRGSISVSDSMFNNAYIYTPKTAVFRIEKVETSNGVFYILHHLNVE